MNHAWDRPIPDCTSSMTNRAPTSSQIQACRRQVSLRCRNYAAFTEDRLQEQRRR